MKLTSILKVLLACGMTGLLPAHAANDQSAAAESSSSSPRIIRLLPRSPLPRVVFTTASGEETSSVETTPANDEAAAKATSNDSGVVFENDLLKLTKERKGAGIASIDSDVTYQITALAKRSITNVHVEDHFPAEVAYVSSVPEGQVKQSGDAVAWDLGTIREGQSKSILVKASPKAKGTFNVCSVVTADPLLCLPITVGQPALQIVKNGPPTVELGSPATWTVTVTNVGDAPAENVTIADTLPDTFAAAGTPVSFEVGTLAPGESRDVTVTANSSKVGAYTNTAVANFDGGEPVSATAPIRIVQSKVEIEKTGAERSYALVNERFTITVRNSGDTDLTGVQVVDRLPANVRVSDVGGGALAGTNEAPESISWNVGDLAAGASRSFNIVMTSTQPGTTVNNASVATASGLTASDSQTTEWIAVPAIQTSIVDNTDPIRVGEPITYTLRVLNQSRFQAIENASVRATFPAEVRPLSVSSGSMSNAVEGNVVNVANINLKPGQDVIFTIQAEGAKAGYGTVIMETSTGFRTTKVVDQESTTVY